MASRQTVQALPSKVLLRDLPLERNATFIGSAGIVRVSWLELADQKRSRLSRGELTPFSERSSAVLLEDIAAVEVAVLVEVVVDRGMGGGDCYRPPETRCRLSR